MQDKMVSRYIFIVLFRLNLQTPFPHFGCAYYIFTSEIKDSRNSKLFLSFLIVSCVASDEHERACKQVYIIYIKVIDTVKVSSCCPHDIDLFMVCSIYVIKL